MVRLRANSSLYFGGAAHDLWFDHSLWPVAPDGLTRTLLMVRLTIGGSPDTLGAAPYRWLGGGGR